MATINIGPFTATVANTDNSFIGTLEPIVYSVGGVNLLQLVASSGSSQGAAIQGSYSPWSAKITGKLYLLADSYSESFSAEASETGFDVSMPKQTIVASEVTGSVSVVAYPSLKLVGDALSLTIKVVLSIPIAYMGISVSLKCVYTEVTTIDVGAASMSKSFSVSASLFGVAISTPSVSVTVSASTIEDIASNVASAVQDQVEAIIEDYLLAWAGELVDMTESVASYMVDFGEEIADAFEDFFTGSSSSSAPPPPFLVNTFAGSAELGSGAMVQFGQALSTSDSAQQFLFPQPFGGTCRVVLLNAARPNIWSALSVGSRASDNFAINRDDAIDYHVPFHWVALGPTTDASLSESGYIDVDDVRIQWGRGTSSSDSEQTFSLSGSFGTGPVAVVVNADDAGIRSALSLSAIDASNGRFKINRDDAIDGSVNFTYLAIGPAPGVSLSQGLLQYEGLTIQWGQASSSSDGEQLFSFPASFNSMNFSVAISFVQAGVQSALALSRAINEAGFIVNRDGRIDGVVPFNWIAVGW